MWQTQPDQPENFCGARLHGGPVGYAFARYRFRRKNTLLFTLLFARTLPPVSVAIPYYFLYFQSGLLGTHIGLIIIYLTTTVPLVTWVLTGFFGAIPKDIEWAARMDGLGRAGALLKVIIPVGASGIAAVGILAFLLAWNEFMIAFVLVGGTSAQTIPVTLLGFFYMYSDVSSEGAALMLALIPPFIIALVFQRYITRLKIVDPVAVELK